MKNKFLKSIGQWFDSSVPVEIDGEPDRIDVVRVLPFLLIHLACLAVFWVGWSWTAIGIAVALYFTRMFAITGFYHRYFSHRSFKTSRAVQFFFAALANSSAQRGPLWWASHHRKHHLNSDQEPDEHSPRWQGFIWSHTGWFLSRGNFNTDKTKVGDWGKFPELRFLDRFDALVPALLLGGLYGLGALLENVAPGLGVNGVQLLIWGGAISTVAVMHATFCINSLAHGVGKPRFETDDDSRNSFILALITLGEGWHNNHHYYPISTRQGFYWWEIDITYYVLKAMAALRIIRDLRPVPEHVLEEGAELDALKSSGRGKEKVAAQSAESDTKSVAANEDAAAIGTAKRGKRLNVTTMILLLLALSLPASGATVGGKSFVDRVRAGKTILNYYGGGVMKYKVVFKGYALALYLPDKVNGKDALKDVAKRLEFHYYWDIPGEKFGEAAEPILKRNLTDAEWKRVRGDVDKLNKLYVDIKKGDRYALTYVPGRGTELSHNNKPLGIIPGKEFAAAYFSIWLGRKPLSNSLKKQLVTK